MWWWTVALAAPEDVQVHRAASSITIDGRLDESAWEVPASGDFERFRPTNGGAPTGRTEVRFLQDDRNLYVGVRVTGVDYNVRAHITPREDINVDDQIGLYLDTFEDGISGYIFYFNALGIQQDIRHNAGNWNVAWNTLLRSKGRVTDDGYVLEIALPWRSLKFPGGQDEQSWGLLVTRKIPSEGSKYGWPRQQRGDPRIFQSANRLVGLQPPARGSGLELIPSLTVGTPLPTDPERGAFEIVRPSLDARFGLTPDIGLAATLNPDFSQVESDVSDIRLNARFAFAFPERRPFFLDGIDWFQDTNDTLYTRSMNEPLYGVKVSGREGPVTIGALQVLDRTPLASFNEKETPGFRPEDVEGAIASNTLLRTRVDAFDGGLAGITLADKRLFGGDGEHQLVGFDMEVPLGGGWLGRSVLQHSRTTDGDDTLWGTRQTARIHRNGGDGTGGGLYFANNSPGYRNELGFTTQSDRTDVGGWANHTFTPDTLVDTLQPFAFADTTQEGNGDAHHRAGAGFDLVMGGVHNLNVWGRLSRFIEGGTTVDGWLANGRWTSNLGSALDVTVRGEAARVIAYDTLLPANTSSTSLVVAFRPTAGIQNSTTLTANSFRSDGDGQVTTLLRNRLNWQFSRELGARWVVDRSRRPDRDPRLYNALLLTWLRNPGTAIWLGGSIVTTGDGEPPEGKVFAKATLLLRP